MRIPPTATTKGTLRGKLRWQLTDTLRADLTLMHVNIDNGYDAWSIYNTYTTYSNQPGRDAQLSNGAALRLVDTIDGVGELAQRHERSQFQDHVFVRRRLGQRSRSGPPPPAIAPYDYFQSDNRNRRTLAEDLRLTGDPSRALFGRCAGWRACMRCA